MSLQSLVAEKDDEFPADSDRATKMAYCRVELPPYSHGDGKDKESVSVWKTRLELTVKACADGQQLHIATILPAGLSGAAYWLPLSLTEQCAAKLNGVFGRKSFLLPFQTFVKARQHRGTFRGLCCSSYRAGPGGLH